MTILVQSLEIERAEFGTGPISKWQLSTQEFSNNIETKLLFDRAVRVNIVCPPADMTAEQKILWDKHITYYSVWRGSIHYIPFDRESPHYISQEAVGSGCVRSAS
jgi:hypothetical protein